MKKTESKAIPVVMQEASVVRKCLLFMAVLMLMISNELCAETAPGKSDELVNLQKSVIASKDRQKGAEQYKYLEDVSGLDWLQMTLKDRQAQILASMYALGNYGVILKKTPGAYEDLVQTKLVVRPSLNNVSITNILASIVYDTEPASRQALDQLRKKPSQNEAGEQLLPEPTG